MSQVMSQEVRIDIRPELKNYRELKSWVESNIPRRGKPPQQWYQPRSAYEGELLDAYETHPMTSGWQDYLSFGLEAFDELVRDVIQTKADGSYDPQTDEERAMLKAHRELSRT